MAKKPSKIKNKTAKAAPVIAKVKTLAKGIAKAVAGKAMASKPAKKNQTKAAPKTAPKVAPKAVGKPEKFAKGAKAGKELKAGKDSKPIKGAKPGNDAKPTRDAKGGKPEVPGKTAKNAPQAPTPVEDKKVKGKAPKTPKPLAVAHHEKMCRESGCENLASTKGYCRLDYIKNWKKIKRKEMILKEGKLNQYIEELVSKYPDKYIEVIRQDLSTEVNFNKVIHDLELDESIDDLDYDGDSIDSLIGSIRKEDDDFGDSEF
ncbi:MAG: hypothetical protein KGP28_06375 [Bdellovibrionales bacterium]|nr:hypothetical protein [Bdellovibrionales bacterium]